MTAPLLNLPLQRLPWIAALIAFSLLPACETTPRESDPDPRDTPLTAIDLEARPVSFQAQVKPLFQERCLPCHNGHIAAGDLDLRSRELAFRSSPNGPFFVPGAPERSKVFRMIRLADDEPGAMPPTGHGLSEGELKLVQDWIAEGADWPSGAEGSLTPTDSMAWRSQ
jgi:hypothetical protein